MSLIQTVGRFPATVSKAEMGESETGTPFVRLDCSDEAGDTISAWLYLSEKAFERTLETLRETFRFDSDFERLSAQVEGKRCSLTTEIEEYNGKDRLKVKWVNPLREVKPIKDQANFLKTLTQKAARIPASAPRHGAAPAKAPAAKPVTAPANEPF